MLQLRKILIAEDNASDAELLLRELHRAGFGPKWDRVDTELEYLKCLTPEVDLVISDYEMPQFSGLQALELLKASGLDIPFIIISGTIGEDTAVAAMKQGAADYLLKDRLGRLGQAINHALEQNKLRRERRETIQALQENAARLRNIFDGVAAFVGLFSLDGNVLELNQAMLRTVGLSREEIVGRPFAAGRWWAHSKEMQDRIAAALALAAQGTTVKEELVAAGSDGQFFVMDAVFNPLRDASGRIGQIVASGIDITKRKLAEQKVREQLDELLRWQEVMLNREERVSALKAEINELLARQSQPARYSNPPL
jgi:PAS domain S-box-containing protein